MLVVFLFGSLVTDYKEVKEGQCDFELGFNTQ